MQDSLEHKKPWFLALNPNGRIPALVDHTAASEINSSGSDSAVGGEGEAEGSGGFALWESGAIMLYLAERFGCFLPSKTPRQRWDTLSWLAFQLSGVGPIQGQAHAFTRYVPERIPYAIDRFQAETRRLCEHRSCFADSSCSLQPTQEQICTDAASPPECPPLHFLC